MRRKTLEQFYTCWPSKNDLISFGANLQETLQELLEHVVCLSQLSDLRRKQINVPVRVRKEMKECMHGVLRSTTAVMIPSAYFRGIISLLCNSDGNVKKKVLLMCIAMWSSHKQYLGVSSAPARTPWTVSLCFFLDLDQ